MTDDVDIKLGDTYFEGDDGGVYLVDSSGEVKKTEYETVDEALDSVFDKFKHFERLI